MQNRPSTFVLGRFLTSNNANVNVKKAEQLRRAAGLTLLQVALLRRAAATPTGEIDDADVARELITSLKHRGYAQVAMRYTDEQRAVMHSRMAELTGEAHRQLDEGRAWEARLRLNSAFIICGQIDESALRITEAGRAFVREYEALANPVDAEAV